MPQYTSLSHAQCRTLHRWLELTMPPSLDVLVETLGTEDAFRLAKMKERFEKAVEEK